MLTTPKAGPTSVKFSYALHTVSACSWVTRVNRGLGSEERWPDETINLCRRLCSIE